MFKLLSSFVAGALVTGASIYLWTRYSEPTFDASSHQAVFLNNGQVFFGKVIERLPNAITLGDVYYVQSHVNPETKEVKNTLIRRGNELHGPRKMTVSRVSILLIEPVSSDSTIGKLIAQQKESATAQ